MKMKMNIFVVTVSAGSPERAGEGEERIVEYIVQSKGAAYDCNTVVAPTGYYRTREGQIKRDGTPSPEMGHIQHAYQFRSHRSAARVASKLAFPIIRESL